MSKILNQDEIDALLSSVSENSEDQNSFKVGKKVELYDFKHPSLMSKEQLHLIENIHQNFSRGFSVSLSAQLRSLVELNVMAVDQFLYSEFVMSVASPSCLYIADFKVPVGRGIVEISPHLAIFIVEKLFGGKGEFSFSEQRGVTPIEQRIMEKITDRLMFDLKKSWDSISNTFSSKIVSFESNPEFVQILPSSEPVMVVSIEVMIHGNKTIMNICYPIIWLSDILGEVDIQNRLLYGITESTPEQQKIIEDSLNKTKVELIARLGGCNLSIGDLLGLSNGDVLLLDRKAVDNIDIFVENYKAFDGYTGKVGKVLGVQVVNKNKERGQAWNI